MHQRFIKEFEALELSFSEVEQAIKCPKNYLSRFVNGTGTLPAKWEKPIEDFLATLKKNVEKITAPPPNLELLKPWVKEIELYCRSIGKDPEGLIEDHKHLSMIRSAIPAKTTMIPKPTLPAPTGNSFMDEQRKKKCGF